MGGTTSTPDRQARYRADSDDSIDYDDAPYEPQPPLSLTVVIGEDAVDAAEIVISGEGDAKIRGDQHRLMQPEPSGEPTGAPLSDAQRKSREDAHRASPLTPVPHDGKLTATYGTNRAEVLLDLPTVGRIKAEDRKSVV